jgi:hypothetical protein
MNAPVWLVMSCQSTIYEVILRVHGTHPLGYLLSYSLQLWSCKFIIIIIIIVVVFLMLHFVLC